MSHTDHTLQDDLEQHLEALKSGADPDTWVRDLLGWLLQDVLDLEFSQFLGAAPYERSQDRKGYRNGFYQRELFTRVGRLTLRVLRDRQGRFSTDIFERYQRSEKALVLALQESYLQGVSTRKVKKITNREACNAKLCGVQFSKDQVSSMAQELDEELATWRFRPLEMAYPYLVVDAHSPEGHASRRVRARRRSGGKRRRAAGQGHSRGWLQGGPERVCGSHGRRGDLE